MKQLLINYIWTLFITSIILFTGYFIQELHGISPFVVVIIAVSIGFFIINLITHLITKLTQIYKDSIKH